jgi:hypothetical protein
MECGEQDQQQSLGKRQVHTNHPVLIPQWGGRQGTVSSSFQEKGLRIPKASAVSPGTRGKACTWAASRKGTAEAPFTISEPSPLSTER